MNEFKKLRSAFLGTAFIATAKAVVAIDEVKKSEHFKRASSAIDELLAKAKSTSKEESVSEETASGSNYDQTLDAVLQNIEAMARQAERREQERDVKFESVYSFLSHSIRDMQNCDIREYLLRSLNLDIDAKSAELIRHFVLRADVQYTNVWKEETPPKHKTLGDFFRSMVGNDIEREVLVNLIYRHMAEYQTSFFISNFDLDNISSGFATSADMEQLIHEHNLDDYAWVECGSSEKEGNIE